MGVNADVLRLRSCFLLLLVLVTPLTVLHAQSRVARMKLESSAFAPGSPIPAMYSHAAQDLSPPLAWSGAPPGTIAFALVCDDPDAPRPGGWVHWVLWDIPPRTTSLKSGLPVAGRLPDGTRQGLNDWRVLGWGGPQPPSGVHHYVFRLYALDELIGGGRAFTRDELLGAIKGHVLATAELVGTFAAR